MANWGSYGYAYLWWPGSRVRAKPWLPRFFRGALTQLPIRILRSPGVEVTDETGKLPPHISAVLNSAPHHIGSHARGAGCFAAEGFRWRIDAATDTFISGDPVRGCAGNRSVSRNASALLRFATQTCRERICPFRLPRLRRHPPVRLTQKPYRYQRKYATKKPSPQAPQGEDNGGRCETLQCT